VALRGSAGRAAACMAPVVASWLRGVAQSCEGGCAGLRAWQAGTGRVGAGLHCVSLQRLQRSPGAQVVADRAKQAWYFTALRRQNVVAACCAGTRPARPRDLPTESALRCGRGDAQSGGVSCRHRLRRGAGASCCLAVGARSASDAGSLQCFTSRLHDALGMHTLQGCTAQGLACGARVLGAAALPPPPAGCRRPQQARNNCLQHARLMAAGMHA
jgi:hypothetical protein